MPSAEHVIEVWGELACFTRPELKVERFSYPVITPSAARGIFEAIFAKPSRDGKQAQFRWQVTLVEILRPPKYIALRRNEVKDKVSVANIRKWMRGDEPVQPIYADGDRDLLGSDAKGRTQRQTMALKNVRYRLHARIVPWPGRESLQQSLDAQFRRRAAQGKCFYQPYFGCREFPAYFELVEADAPLPADAWRGDLDIGLMVYDVFDLSRPGTCHSAPRVSLFRARVERGRMIVPP
jgi:CRISPR-associated protein Cas5, subtype I-C/DVULG